MNSVFFTQDYMMFLQDFGCTEEHRHETSHLTISLEGKMHCKIEENIVDCYGYILGPRIKHQRFGENADSLKIIFIFDPAAPVYLNIKKHLLKNKAALFISQKQNEKIHELIGEVFEKKEVHGEWQGYVQNEKGALLQVVHEIFSICGMKDEIDSGLDERVNDLLSVIKEEETVDNQILDKVCEKQHLSRSRMLHLFKAEIGISFKKYMQYQKFFKTWHYLAQGENITSACIHAGYSDSAHYSKFMKQCFGLSTKRELNSIDGIYEIAR